MSDPVEELRLKLPVSTMELLGVLTNFAGVDSLVIYRQRPLEDAYLGQIKGVLVGDLVKLPLSIVQKFGPGTYRVIGRRGAAVVAILILEAGRPLVVVPN